MVDQIYSLRKFFLQLFRALQEIQEIHSVDQEVVLDSVDAVKLVAVDSRLCGIFVFGTHFGIAAVARVFSVLLKLCSIGWSSYLLLVIAILVPALWLLILFGFLLLSPLSKQLFFLSP